MEQWRNVPGMSGIEASDFGRIRRDGKLSSDWSIRGQRRHRIIARTWIGLKPGQYVKFRRGGSCRVSNLYVCTSAESHKRRPARGENAGTAKLTERQAREILELRAKRLQREIAPLYGVTRQTISDIWCAKSWRHLHDTT